MDLIVCCYTGTCFCPATRPDWQQFAVQPGCKLSPLKLTWLKVVYVWYFGPAGLELVHNAVYAPLVG